MITRLTHISVFVLDQDSAKALYTDNLGFDRRADITMGEAFEGCRRRLSVAYRRSEGISPTWRSSFRTAQWVVSPSRPTSCGRSWLAVPWDSASSRLTTADEPSRSCRPSEGTCRASSP
jgi:catechol 2,3-dioxygenase-like lactoylglutathione lyase family enzyme